MLAKGYGGKTTSLDGETYMGYCTITSPSQTN